MRNKGINTLKYFFSIIILITQTYKTKNIAITRYYCIFPVPGKKEKKTKTIWNMNKNDNNNEKT